MSILKLSRPFPSSKNSHFQNEAECLTSFVKMSFIWMRIKISKSRNDRRSEHNLCNCVKKPEKFFFSGFFTQLHKFRSLRRSFLHFRSSWFMSYIINNKNIIINSSALNSFATEVWGNSKMAWWLLHKWRDGWLYSFSLSAHFWIA